jgi:hypothetical protein
MARSRTYIVPAWGHPTRDAWVDEGADAAGGGLDDVLPSYLGVWVDPEHDRSWHVFSDYPPCTPRAVWLDSDVLIYPAATIALASIEVRAIGV